MQPTDMSKEALELGINPIAKAGQGIVVIIFPDTQRDAAQAVLPDAVRSVAKPAFVFHQVFGVIKENANIVVGAFGGISVIAINPAVAIHAPMDGFKISVVVGGDDGIRTVIVEVNIFKRGSLAVHGETRAIGEGKDLRTTLNSDEQTGRFTETGGEIAGIDRFSIDAKLASIAEGE